MSNGTEVGCLSRCRTSRAENPAPGSRPSSAGPKSGSTIASFCLSLKLWRCQPEFVHGADQGTQVVGMTLHKTWLTCRSQDLDFSGSPNLRLTMEKPTR